LASERTAQALSAGSHGSTFGGNPMSMAAANAVLDVILAPGFLEGVNKTAKTLWGRLEELAKAYPGVIEHIRGSGLMIGIKCRADSGDLRARMHDAGLLSVGAADNVVRLLPPLIIDDSHIDEAIEILTGVCRQMEEEAEDVRD
ncbi:MAG: aminotransferase class III-fold pyridoxal phosphate-dependent enzyme, partial [Rhodospirillales bacterium]|nr:aminotransferase class III-fold pyridoxal phosphate-dependent enzyme [Rhodospirillales bacterium]